MTIRLRSWLEVLKVLGVVATIVGSAVGSYKAAKSDAKIEASASYEALREAVEHLDQNQKMIWDVLMKTPSTLTKSLEPYIEPISSKSLIKLRPLPRSLEEVVAQKPMP